MKSIILFLITSMALSAHGQEGFVLNGTIDPAFTPIAKVFLRYENSSGNRVTDTTAVRDHRFVMTGRLVQPSYVEIGFVPDSTRVQTKLPRIMTYPIAMDNAVMQLTYDGTSKLMLEGSPTQKMQLNYIAALISKGKKPDRTALMDSFIRANPDSHFSLLLLESLLSSASRMPQYEELFLLLPDSLRDTPKGRKIAAKLINLTKLAPGKPAPDFSLPDVKGVQHSLSALRGKYVFLEFWGTYCPACRVENTHVAAAYQDLRGLPIVFVGISLDVKRGKKAWIEAMKKDGLQGLQLGDIDGHDGQAAKAFEIRGIPDNFLIDPDGKILARDIRGYDVSEKIRAFIK
ncbi:TlpA disulfide reductase family protein [Sediminibacterium sp.]|uniref:TlpA disulfide reductase family protein n=1 Tax=Sediminibacterium sp. TaxID=1917865 RepID=UPI0027300B98|nr:TlpA disulfide reductase family protein [Sediminibacterium sp.]MDP2421441.1 TlpA disulfide reductase family protein [Sediminibacterium sp.]